MRRIWRRQDINKLVHQKLVDHGYHTPVDLPIDPSRLQQKKASTLSTAHSMSALPAH